jgi:hypothetical protein
MNMTMPQQSLSSMLAQVATIVSVRSSSLGMTRTDKNASKEADRAHNARGGTAKVVVSRLTGSGEERVKAINQLVNQLGTDLRFMTTVWRDERLLANLQMQEWLGIWSKAKGEHTRLVDSFVADAPMLIQEANQNLGTFNVAPPTEDEIREAFSLDFDMQPIPDVTTYKTSGFDAAVEAELKRRFEASIEAAYTTATNDALQKVAKPLTNLVEGMEKYSKREEEKARGLTVDKSGTFKDTITGNVDAVAAVFKSFNLTNDPLLTSIADRLTALTGIDPDGLRNDPAYRKDTVKKARDILDDLKDLI